MSHFDLDECGLGKADETTRRLHALCPWKSPTATLSGVHTTLMGNQSEMLSDSTQTLRALAAPYITLGFPRTVSDRRRKHRCPAPRSCDPTERAPGALTPALQVRPIPPSLNTTTVIWSAGPDFLGSNDMADAAFCHCAHGNVLATHQGYGKSPNVVLRFNGTGLKKWPPPRASTGNSEAGPHAGHSPGSILLTHVARLHVVLHHNRTYKAAWRPHICTGPDASLRVALGQDLRREGHAFYGSRRRILRRRRSVHSRETN